MIYSKTEKFFKKSFGRNRIFSLSPVLQYKQIIIPCALVFVLWCEAGIIRYSRTSLILCDKPVYLGIFSGISQRWRA